MSVWGFAKLQNILGSLENHPPGQSCAHTQERTEKVPILSPLADFEALHKQEVKTQTEL